MFGKLMDGKKHVADC